MAQFKRDQKNICLSPLTTVHIFSKIRSHGGLPEVAGLRLSMVIQSHFGTSLVRLAFRMRISVASSLMCAYDLEPDR